MRLSINGRVVKSYDVEVSTPRMVECSEGFQQLGAFLTVLSVGEESQNSVNSEILEQPDEMANPIEAEAKEKATMILAEAENCAQTILEEARADFDRLRQEVVETARTEVYPAAQVAGYQAGLQEGEAEGKRLAEKANQLFQLAQRAVQEEYAKVDEDLLHLAMKIAERVVRASLAVEPQRLMAIIQGLTLLPQERLGWRLHVAPDDSRLLEEDQSPCPWVIDESLNPGDCFLECQEGIFDARLEAQLDKLEHTLREELEHGSVESIDADGGPD
ncbi:MAG TPA: FliH/SctL family protein [Desulfosporosinus sp.]|nr:FliH/SctL family protein [Desulfosporosinus sp.]